MNESEEINIIQRENSQKGSGKDGKATKLKVARMQMTNSIKRSALNEAAVRYNCTRINDVLVTAAPSALF